MMTDNFSVNHSSQGFTLIELIVAIAVASILLVLAAPSVQELLKNNQVASQNNELIALVNLAKSQAVRLNDDVILELFEEGNSWRANVRLPGNVPADLDAGCPSIDGVIRCASNSDVKLTASDSTLVFNNRGYLELSSGGSDDWTSATLRLQHKNCSNPRQVSIITILPTGQISDDGDEETCS